MWWPTHARAPLATQNVLLSSAPHASSGRAVPRQRQRAGHEPARAAQQQRAPARDGPQHRVVRARVDRAVVAEHEVGDAREPRERVLVLVRDRLVGDVAARHHQRLAGVGEQQVVQRRVGQQDAEVGAARRDRGGDRRVGAARREHDRAVAPGQQRGLLVGQRDERTRRGDVAHHHRERLVLPVLARPQRRDRRLARRQAGEVVAADALDRDDGAVPQRRHRRAQRRVPAEVAERRASARTRGTRWAARGSAGRPGRGTRRRSAGTGRSRPSW